MIKLKDGTKIMMKDEREPFHKHDNWHNNIVHWKDSSCPTCIKEGIKQGYVKALDDVKKVIDVHLDRKHKQLENKELPELTQANISGMIIALIITKEEIAKLKEKKK